MSKTMLNSIRAIKPKAHYYNRGVDCTISASTPRGIEFIYIVRAREARLRILSCDFDRAV